MQNFWYALRIIGDVFREIVCRPVNATLLHSLQLGRHFSSHPFVCYVNSPMFFQITKERFAAYFSKTRLTATVYSEHNHRLAIAKEFLNASHENKWTNKHQVLIAATRCKCFFCCRAYHE